MRLRAATSGDSTEKLSFWVDRMGNQGWSKAFGFLECETTGSALAPELLRIAGSPEP